MRSIVSTFVVLFAILSASHCAGSDESGLLQTILVSSANAIGCESARSDMNSLLSWGAPQQDFEACQIPITSATTKQDILEAIRHLRITPTTTFVFYYAGHGQLMPDGRHQLILDSTEPDCVLDRSELLDAIAKKKPRLAIVITDCCSEVATKPPKRGKFVFDKALFHDLFLQPTGLVDLTSAEFHRDKSTNQYAGMTAWTDASGPVFTNALLDLLNDPQTRQRLLEKGEPATWKSFMTPLMSQTDERYRILRQSVETDTHIFPAIAKSLQAEIHSQQHQLPMLISH